MSESRLIIGIDEAGYGPSIGPLTIVASCWRDRSGRSVEDWSEHLEPEFLARPWKPGDTHIPIGDSKKIFQPKLGTLGLRTGIRFLLDSVGTISHHAFDECLTNVASEDASRVVGLPWYQPQWKTEEEVFPEIPREVSAAGRNKLESLDVRFLGYVARVVDEREFNRLLDDVGNKSAILSEYSLRLAIASAQRFVQDGESVHVFCDKHGGRNRYQSLLSHVHDSVWVRMLVEGQQCSRYELEWQDRTYTYQFRVEGDSLFPSAASSLLAKWMREVCMGRFNAFWRSATQRPTLRPTAGYYVDALRFKQDIQETEAIRTHPPETWWRKK